MKLVNPLDEPESFMNRHDFLMNGYDVKPCSRFTMLDDLVDLFRIVALAAAMAILTSLDGCGTDHYYQEQATLRTACDNGRPSACIDYENNYNARQNESLGSAVWNHPWNW